MPKLTLIKLTFKSIGISNNIIKKSQKKILFSMLIAQKKHKMLGVGLVAGRTSKNNLKLKYLLRLSKQVTSDSRIALTRNVRFD